MMKHLKEKRLKRNRKNNMNMENTFIEGRVEIACDIVHKKQNKPHFLAHKSRWQLLQDKSIVFLSNNSILQQWIEDWKDTLEVSQKE